jgi:hypothetical protein
VLLSGELTGLLNEQWLRELVRVDREMLRDVVIYGAVFSITRHFAFSSTLIIYVLHRKYFVILFCKNTYSTHLLQVRVNNVKCGID